MTPESPEQRAERIRRNYEMSTPWDSPEEIEGLTVPTPDEVKELSGLGFRIHIEEREPTPEEIEEHNRKTFGPVTFHGYVAPDGTFYTPEQFAELVKNQP